MRFQIVSAAAASLLWACPSAAFQMVKPAISRAAAPRNVNVAPLMETKPFFEDTIPDTVDANLNGNLTLDAAPIENGGVPPTTDTAVINETEEGTTEVTITTVQNNDPKDLEISSDASSMDAGDAALMSEFFQTGGTTTVKVAREPSRLQKAVAEGGPLSLVLLPIAVAEVSAQAMADYIIQSWKATVPSGVRVVLRLAAKDFRRGAVDAEWFKLIFDFGLYGTVLNLKGAGLGTQLNTSSVINVVAESLPKALVPNATYEYDTYPVHAEYPHKSLKGMMKMVKGVPHLEYWFSFKKIFRALTFTLKGSAGLAVNPLTINDLPSQENYEKIFKAEGPFGLEFKNPFLPFPQQSYDNWKEDQEFSRQFLNGVNPVMIEVVKDSSKLTPELLEFYDKEDITNITALAEANRLFYVDYIGLDDLEKNPHQAYPEAYNNLSTTGDMGILERVGKEPRYFKAPMILFRQTQDLKNLEVMAIQLDRGAGSKVYTVGNTNEREWLFAKATVASADSQYHEWVSHLGRTHLTMEPHIVAIHNTLRKHNHKVYPFVRPMCRDTLLLNFAARYTLGSFGPSSFGDYMTSVGTGQYMQLILKYWETYDFFKSSAFDEEMEGRGFTDDVKLDNYRYRNDGKELWEAYGIFATQFVDECYESDQEIADDDVLQLWAYETSHESRAAIKGFPKRFTSKAQLTKTLQTLFWICSGFHAAINFPQYDFYAYPPNKPIGFRKSVEDWREADGSERWMYEEAMPTLDTAQEAVITTHALTLASKHTILDLDYCFEPTQSGKTVHGKKAYRTFKKNLARITNKIELRSKEDARLGEPTYEYLKPENVPASIDI